MSAYNGRLFLHTCAECEAPTDNKSMICDECAPLYDPVRMDEDIAAHEARHTRTEEKSKGAHQRARRKQVPLV